MSLREALVYEINLTPHPNADSLSLVFVDGWQCVVRTDDWKSQKTGIFIPPDTIVNTNRPEFSFLSARGEKVKIRGVKLRGEMSVGLLIPAPDGANIGDNFYESLELEHYEPELTYTINSDFESAPDVWKNLQKYDLENLRSSKIQRLFIDKEIVAVTHKLNGSNCSFTFTENKMWAKSRSGFRKESEGNIFWECLNNTPSAIEFCKTHPEMMLIGECIGNVKNFKYDTNGVVSFRCFDIMRPNRTYLDYHDWLITCKLFDIPTVPIIDTMEFNFEKLLELAESPCPIGNKINEGIVVKTLKERKDPKFGRVIGKIVSNQYLES